MMSFEEFKEILREKVADTVDGEVTVVTVPKNNGVQLEALSVKRTGCNIAPVVYLAGYYNDYNKGRSIENIVEGIVSLCEREAGISGEIINDFMDYDKMKDYTRMKLVNKDNNSELLNNVPYVEFLDLAIIFILDIPLLHRETEGTVTISNKHMEMWGVDKDELFVNAKINSLEKSPAVIKSMNEVIRDMYINGIAGEIAEDDEIYAMLDSSESYLYVLTNEAKHNGAITMTYENVIRDFANEKESNVYILPSSIHEVILVPAEGGMSTSELRDMVQSVNQSEVDEVEVLSDNVYYYDRETDKITIA